MQIIVQQARDFVNRGFGLDLVVRMVEDVFYLVQIAEIRKIQLTKLEVGANLGQTLIRELFSDFFGEDIFIILDKNYQIWDDLGLLQSLRLVQCKREILHDDVFISREILLENGESVFVVALLQFVLSNTEELELGQLFYLAADLVDVLPDEEDSLRGGFLELLYQEGKRVVRLVQRQLFQQPLEQPENVVFF
jgi:hypothetical protein